jgi:hypothetical protein
MIKIRIFKYCLIQSLLFILILYISTIEQIVSQTIPVSKNDESIYSFLEELPARYNTVVTPLSRNQISEILRNIDVESLNERQKKELAFYLRDYNKGYLKKDEFKRRLDLFYYQDSTFSITVNPILGSDFFSNKNGSEYHWWNGAEAWATLKKWGIFGSIRDNHESTTLTDPLFLINNPGGTGFKISSDGKVDYVEIKGGITYEWKTGSLGLIKNNFIWGTGNNGSNIFSGRPPSFVHLDFHLNPVKWFDFHYVHGWLNSEVVDSTMSFYVTNSYGTDYREVYHKKFLAANMFTFFPVSGLGLSLGNSIIYDYDHVHPAFLIPFMFFKALDHSLNYGIENMNSQMFFDISSKNLKHFHLYSTIFIDEFSVKRITDPDRYNFISYKGGVKISNLINNTFACFEYTITNALTFMHDVPTTTFESNRFNLGHYLTDNAKEMYFTIGYKPIRNLVFQVSYINALKGPDHTELGTLPRDEIKPFSPVIFERKSIVLKASWQPVNDLYFRLGYEWQDISGAEEALIKYTPQFLWGKTVTITAGINFGF